MVLVVKTCGACHIRQLINKYLKNLTKKKIKGDHMYIVMFYNNNKILHEFSKKKLIITFKSLYLTVRGGGGNNTNNILVLCKGKIAFV